MLSISIADIHQPNAHPNTLARSKIITNSLLTTLVIFDVDAPNALRTPISFIFLIIFNDTSVNKPVTESISATMPKKTNQRQNVNDLGCIEAINIPANNAGCQR